MTFDEAKTVLEELQEKYRNSPEKLQVAMATLEVAIPEFRWIATDDCAAVVKTRDETGKFKINSPRAQREEGREG